MICTTDAAATAAMIAAGTHHIAFVEMALDGAGHVTRVPKEWILHDLAQGGTR